MLKLVSDENFNADILRGLFRRRPDLDIVPVQDIGLSAAPDSDILAWAAVEDRILLTHCRRRNGATENSTESQLSKSSCFLASVQGMPCSFRRCWIIRQNSGELA